MMVMGSIEQFARQLEEIEKDTAHRDSIATWLLSIPIEDVVKYGDSLFIDALSETIDLSAVTYDRTAETIFSSNIDTWKNMGNFKFINSVGNCFSEMNLIEEHHNGSVLELLAVFENIVLHESAYPGNTRAEKALRNEEARAQLATLECEDISFDKSGFVMPDIVADSLGTFSTPASWTACETRNSPLGNQLKCESLRPTILAIQR